MVPVVLLLVVSARLVLVNNDRTLTPLNVAGLGCGDLEPLWLEAQSVPSASLVPCVQSVPPGWRFAGANVGTAGRSTRSTTWSLLRAWSCG